MATMAILSGSGVERAASLAVWYSQARDSGKWMSMSPSAAIFARSVVRGQTGLPIAASTRFWFRLKVKNIPG